jgi:hypothetical protein
LSLFPRNSESRSNSQNSQKSQNSSDSPSNESISNPSPRPNTSPRGPAQPDPSLPRTPKTPVSASASESSKGSTSTKTKGKQGMPPIMESTDSNAALPVLKRESSNTSTTSNSAISHKLDSEHAADRDSTPTRELKASLSKGKDKSLSRDRDS